MLPRYLPDIVVNASYCQIQRPDRLMPQRKGMRVMLEAQITGTIIAPAGS